MLEPLVDWLNEQFLPSQTSKFTVFTLQERDDKRVAIVLPLNVTVCERTMRAVITLLRKTGADAIPTEPQPFLFELVSNAAWLESSFWFICRALVFEQIDEELDATTAERRVARLIAYLKDPTNLVKLGREDKALF